MSIYPVPLAKWFTREDDDYNLHETAVSIVKTMRCHACGKRCRWSKAWGYHSLPWGYGELWCSEKCLYSGKVARPDKRRERRLRRREYYVVGRTETG